MNCSDFNRWLAAAVGLLLLVVRPVTRVLDLQRGGNDQDLLQAVFLLRCQDHPSDPRIDALLEGLRL